MSIEVMMMAYKTPLGNSTAKNVLVLLGNVANDEGYGWPSVERIAEYTDVDRRTVRRVLQVFQLIGLISKVSRGKHKTPGVQLDLSRMGIDLRQAYKETYLQVQSKSFPQCRSDRDEAVAATADGVAATADGVAATVPPHPHIGGTVSEPSCELPPYPPKGGDGESEARFAGKEENSPAQMELAVCNAGQDRHAGDHEKASLENTPVRDLARDRCGSGESGVATDRLARAVEQVMHGCSFSKKKLRPVLRGQLKVRADAGEDPATIALAMIDAWKRFTNQGKRLRARWSPANFFSEGHWRNSQGWHWDNDTLREEQRTAEARVGSF